MNQKVFSFLFCAVLILSLSLSVPLQTQIHVSAVGFIQQKFVWFGIGEDYLMWTGNPNSWFDAVVYQSNPPIHVNTYEKIQRWGFNTVRLAFGNPSLGLNLDSAYDSAKMNQVLDIVYAAGAQAILDLHNGNPDSTDLFGSDAWVSFWQTLTQTYLNDSRVIAFEVFNEPCAMGGPAMPSDGNVNYAYVNAAFEKVLAAIRQIDPNRIVVYPFCWWEVPEWSQTIINDGKVVAAMHDWIWQGDSTASVVQRVTNLLDAVATRYGKNRVWLGEIGVSSGSSEFVRLIVNGCLQRDIGFSWLMYKDCYSIIDVGLSQSNW